MAGRALYQAAMLGNQTDSAPPGCYRRGGILAGKALCIAFTGNTAQIGICGDDAPKSTIDFDVELLQSDPAKAAAILKDAISQFDFFWPNAIVMMLPFIEHSFDPKSSSPPERRSNVCGAKKVAELLGGPSMAMVVSPAALASIYASGRTSALCIFAGEKTISVAGAYAGAATFQFPVTLADGSISLDRVFDIRGGEDQFGQVKGAVADFVLQEYPALIQWDMIMLGCMPSDGCKLQVMKELRKNIILSGDKTKTAAIVAAIEAAAAAKGLTKGEDFKCIAPPERLYSSWIGGSILGSLGSTPWADAKDITGANTSEILLQQSCGLAYFGNVQPGYSGNAWLAQRSTENGPLPLPISATRMVSIDDIKTRAALTWSAPFAPERAARECQPPPNLEGSALNRTLIWIDKSDGAEERSAEDIAADKAGAVALIKRPAREESVPKVRVKATKAKRKNQTGTLTGKVKTTGGKERQRELEAAAGRMLPSVGPLTHRFQVLWDKDGKMGYYKSASLRRIFK